MPFERYNAIWPDSYKGNDLGVEMRCIQNGGEWTNNKGVLCGKGLRFHYGRMKNIIWPHLDDHRWAVLMGDEILRPNNDVVVVMGCASSGKTNSCVWYLMEYFCFPETTLVMVSSTDIRSLRMRVWAEISKLWSMAKKRFGDVIPGHLIDSRCAITTDSLDKDAIEDFSNRDMRKGVIGIPTEQGGHKVGLRKWIGIKQERIRIIADEAQMMGGTFLDAFANLSKNASFKSCIYGNPDDLYDPLGKSAEPKEGWKKYLNPTKTTVWKTRFMDGTCINLVGTDSPNFDYPPDQPPRYPYLINAKQIALTISSTGKDTPEYYQMCLGVMQIGLMAKRVLSSELVRQFSAQEDVTWSGAKRTKVYGIDASYGGDRCVAGYAEFGPDKDGNIILAFGEPYEIPIVVDGGEPEDQIAHRVKADCLTLDVPPENVYHDSTGRGSLGTSFARIWSNQCNPVEFGGSPTQRPVCLDMFKIDEKTGQQRLVRGDEHYDRFVTELWFSVRYAVESGQIRRLPEKAKEELCLRSWEDKKGKKSIEPKTGTQERPGMKQRIGRSPDYGDWASIIVEGARRLGFQTNKLGSAEKESAAEDWFTEESKRYADAIESQRLNYA